MQNKVLIANRGEIAVRIIRACKEMGIATVAVYSQADKDSLHVKLADEAVCIGPTSSKDSYLNIKSILSAAISTGSTLIHPGYGFLSENSKFSQMVKECKIKFIGPNHKVIDMMGNKTRARDIAKQADIPVVPGSEGVIETPEEGLKVASKIGYPVLIKASSGGGGRGMRVVNEEKEFKKAFETASLEAENCFGDKTVYVEKLIENPRHIEIQIIADQHGNVVHLGERDCSIQRRKQKVIEEAPSPFIDEELRKKIGDAAVKISKHVKYENAGTVEFITDKEGNFYFIEMNTRLQVEHPVTELVTGVDLVKEQIRVANGKKLSFKQKDIKIEGHAIECRINAEDPEQNFMPSPGKINGLLLPGGLGVRIDTFIYNDYSVVPYYDSMIGKLIVHAKTRKEAIRRMRRSLEEFIIDGIKTNIEFQYVIMHDPEYVRGNYDTGFVENFLKKANG
ncbi:acetyl-CoA carboxylase biotin carboxylase subunit [Haloplasma contractile]|nr:acetyl-CoA carboxylase biotin carboxylase subunit [Haloplasma contractile]